MVQDLNGTTRVLAIIGHPVSHSMSPVMQNAALRACGLNYIYVPFEVTPDSLGEAVAGLKALGVAGMNVTIPHKSEIMKYLDGLDESALAAGAVNTVNNESGHLIGYNTDGEGLVSSLAADLDFIPADRTILLIGAGGAARGALAALCRAGARKVMVFNRTYGNAAELVASMSKRYSNIQLQALADERAMNAELPCVDLIINATSVGMKHENGLSVSLQLLPRTARIYDMVYVPELTGLLSEAAREGLRGANGLGMLAAQGERAFTIWTGVTPPSGLMRRVLSGICNN
jgi:shikimate dehydrogenase